MTAVYVFGGIMALLVLAVVFAPLVEDRMRRTSEGESAEGRKHEAIDALRELEFEYQTGKVSDEDYARLRSTYARAAIAARDDLGEAVGPGACQGCGAPRKEGAKFCSSCGAQLA